MRPRVERSPRLDLLPLIDVVFLLLAVFVYSMVAMVRAHVVPVDLPLLATGESRSLGVVLVISVAADGTLRVGGETLAADEIERSLRARREADPALQVVLNADREARHGAVAEVFDRVRAAGVERILMVGRPAGVPADAAGAAHEPTAR